MGHRFEYQSSWGANLPASTQAANSALVIANLFQFAVGGYIVGIRWCRAANDDEEHIGAVTLESDNSVIGAARFRLKTGATPTGWQNTYLHPRVPVTAGVNYYVGVSFGSREWRYTNGALSSGPIVVGDVTVLQDSSSHWNGQFSTLWTHTTWTRAAGVRYGVDCLFLRGDLT